MLRWLVIALVLAVASTSADAQVFRPKGKAAEKKEKAAPAADSEKKEKAAPAADSESAPEKKPAKKQPRAAPPKKRVTKKKKNASEDASESEPKGAAKDYVKIWDDDEPE